MNKDFAEAATSRHRAEEALEAWNIPYQQMPGNFLYVPGNVSFTRANMTELPDLSQVIVGGNFYCEWNQLSSLIGAPHEVRGTFLCDNNRLISLEGAPEIIGGHFSCARNQLSSLEHAPVRVGGIFSCAENQLTSLEHAPATGTDFFCGQNKISYFLWPAPAVINGVFDCSGNPLLSLVNAPREVAGLFNCKGALLDTLEGAPQKFGQLESDFGTFHSWDDVPSRLRISDRTGRMLGEDATVLQAPLQVRRPLSLRR